ncbi:universal stress protein [Vagococcus elongatus]|uniref:Universal stress protein n=1 Tax=Vagococcus elongatus TaxID=180344 RepID=A0A430ALN6_9ENTE|nr:universal stress protein [Vagococcus elongatus]RSU08843.1 universal stress protein UspA [Vagococcus elongatus]
MVDNYQRILVAVDGSEKSEKAFQEAISVAKRNGAKLFIAAIVNDVELTTSAYAFSKLLIEEKKKLEINLLKKIDDASRQGIDDTVPIVEIGNPKEYLAHIIPEEREIDLIIVGATGKGAIQRALVGSTTSYVVTHAPCNVMVIR